MRIWDASLNAFRDVQTIRRYDKDLHAYVDVEAAYITEAGVRRQVWPVKKYLYKDGDECTGLTGGWVVGYIPDSYGQGSAYKRNTYLELYSPSYAQRPSFYTKNTITVSAGCRLAMKIYQERVITQNIAGAYGFRGGFLSNTQNRGYDSGVAAANGEINGMQTIYSDPFEKPVSGHCRVNIDAGGDYNGTQKIYVYEIWLEA